MRETCSDYFRCWKLHYACVILMEKNLNLEFNPLLTFGPHCSTSNNYSDIGNWITEYFLKYENKVIDQVNEDQIWFNLFAPN